MAKKIDTTPIYHRPEADRLDDVKRDAYQIKERVISECLIADTFFVRWLLHRGHTRDSALWAIHELYSQGEFKAYRVNEIPKSKQNWIWVWEHKIPAGMPIAEGVLHIDDGKTDWGYLWFEPVQTAKRRADKKNVRWPKSVDAQDLCKKLAEELPKGRSYVEIAREFTHGNKVKAQSLLKTCRRYSHLYKSGHPTLSRLDHAKNVFLMASVTQSKR